MKNMSLLNTIKNDETLSKYLKDGCQENNVFANITEELSEDDYLILEVTRYYQKLRLSETPATPDCFFVVHCGDEIYSIAIVELKRKNFRPREIKEKFATCFEDFMIDKFPQYFDRMFRRIDLFLVVGEEKYPSANYDKGQLLKDLTDTTYTHHGIRTLIKYKTSPHTITPCE